jgi:hypothetical protein
MSSLRRWIHYVVGNNRYAGYCACGGGSSAFVIAARLQAGKPLIYRVVINLSDLGYLLHPRETFRRVDSRIRG